MQDAAYGCCYDSSIAAYKEYIVDIPIVYMFYIFPPTPPQIRSTQQLQQLFSGSRRTSAFTHGLSSPPPAVRIMLPPRSGHAL